MRRCRFIATDPPAALPPIRLVGENRDEDALLGNPLVVEERGRFEDAAILGSEVFPLREALCGVPDARFLRIHPVSIYKHHMASQSLPFLDNVCLQRQWSYNPMKFLETHASAKLQL